MASKLIQTAGHEAENPIGVCLRGAFGLIQSQLRPPFPLTIPSPPEYINLNRAILHGILSEPHLAKVHIKHLHGKITDNYSFFTTMLTKVVNDLYPKLVDTAKGKLVWVTSEMVSVSAIGINGLLVALLRQIVSGDEFLVVFRVGRLSSNSKLDVLKQLEIKFCIQMFREQFHLCFKIGRDLVRLLQELVHIPEIQAIWKDLLFNPGEFKTSDYRDISQIYLSRAPSRYFLLHITPDMETQLRFLLAHVNLGSQKRYRAWFGVIPRWSIIEWLLKSCGRNYVQANAKLALFYDWLFFDERLENVMNIEPAILAIVHSIPKYIDVAHTLLEFLFLLIKNYDVGRKDIINHGVLSAFCMLVRKGVVRSLDILVNCDAISPVLKQRLVELFSGMKATVSKELQPVLKACSLDLLKASSVEAQNTVAGNMHEQ
ncbi:hypothetical protein RHSIM_Rhsim13G0218500 [Rhododendron simsii]|uniref:Integrator complex subunit 3 N-terminal domain-containing protein n=1 Tax=Rhododendron simsii TaxID=118357 RepID=A0A834G156_RHOSS|nr:hypothetical protein RHSIM_Rhsim13G0218500 [Rhododendron simsii]